jgi:hypothetical protein
LEAVGKSPAFRRDDLRLSNAAALLGFLPAAARAWIVAADLRRSNRTGSFPSASVGFSGDFGFKSGKKITRLSE